jgi:Arc/MetJ family transcription regulator
MTRRRLDVDDKLLEQAREVLGTRTRKDTVNAALDETVRRHLWRRHIERLKTMEGLDLHDPEVMKRAWR